MQAKLLRVLQDGEYTQLGSSVSLKADVRLVAATNEKLEEMISRKTFRKDLYYRIKGGWLHLPPLRERTEDIPLLVDHFLDEYCGPSRQCRIDAETLCLLTQYDYPGNIRELKSIIQSAVNLSEGKNISAKYFPEELRQQKDGNHCSQQANTGIIAPLAQVERDHILEAYRRLNGNKSQTARVLGIGLNTLRRKLKSYNIN
jgi:transcriptional regulator with PAS, ATPase and Fis domain